MTRKWKVVLSRNNKTNTTPGIRSPLLIPMALIVVMVVSACAAGAVLFFKYRLDDARLLTIEAIRSRVGVEFGFASLSAEGLRTLHVDGLHAVAPVPGLGNITLDVDVLRLSFSLLDLIQGRAVIGNADIDGGRLVIDRTDTDSARPGVGRGSSRAAGFSLAAWPSMSLSGRDFSIEVRPGKGMAPLLFEPLAFQLANSAEVPEANLQLSTTFAAADNTGVLSAQTRYRRADSFDLSIDIADLTPGHLAGIIDLPEGLRGAISPRLRLWGRPEQQIMVQLEADIREIQAPDMELPILLDSMSGVLRVLALWDGQTRRVEVYDGELSTSLATLSAAGHVDFNSDTPQLDMTAVLSDLSVEALLPELLPESVAALGDMTVTVPSGATVTLGATGSVSEPQLAVTIAVPEAEVALAPANANWPRGQLRIERIQLHWDDINALPTGLATITKGSISAAQFGVAAEDLAGLVSLDASGVSLRSVTAIVSGRPWSGNVKYMMPSGAFAFDVAGVLTDIDQTPLHDLVEKLWLGGDIAFRCSGSYGPGGRLQLKAAADVTRGAVAFEWWLDKPVGVGASIHDIEVLIEPGNTLEVRGEASIENTDFKATFAYVPHEGRWQTRHIRLDIPYLEVNSAGKCIQMPYTALGGACRNGYYEWRPAGDRMGDNVSIFGGHFDHVSFLPDGGENPLVCHDASVTVTLTTKEDVERTGEIVIHAGEAYVPPFGDQWLLPLGPTDPEYIEKYPGEPRPMVYKLSADTIVVPPWEGRSFEAEVYTNEAETGFRFYRAESGNGKLEGTYRHEKDDNIVHLQAEWDTIPATYLIRHLALPEILAGDISGAISYSVDQDDPRATMHAEGQFTIERGHFIAEELGHLLMDEIGGSIITLHPDALAFERVASDLRIVGDTIHTDNLSIKTGGLAVSGTGVWVMEGDLDYRVDIAVTPDFADQIPILRDSFNIQGFRMTQRDIELGFHITGPTSRPKGQLAGLPPVGVTLVSGAAEMTGEAFRLLDTPRQMFMSVFRIGGGILGATRTQQQQQQQQQQQE